MASSRSKILDKTYVPLVALVVLLVIFAVWWLVFGQNKANKAGQILPLAGSVVAKLPERSAPHPRVMLANKQPPVPTNAWFSGLVFGGQNSPVFAYPWSFETTKSGASLSVPQVVSQANTVLGDHANDLSANLGSDDYAVKSFGDLSATIEFLKSGQPVATAKITEGSPYIFWSMRPNRQTTLTANGNFKKLSSSEYVVSVGAGRYGLKLGQGVSAQAAGKQIILRAAKAGRFTLIELPNGAPTQEVFELASNRIVKTSVSYRTKGASTVTTFHIKTANGKPTLFGLLPHQYNHAENFKSVGNLPTILGQEKFTQANNFSYKLTENVPGGKIITSELSAQQKAKLGSLIEQDIQNTKFTATDSYGGGKQLYRAANLLELAHELNRPALASQIQTSLKAQLDMWLDPNGYAKRVAKYFYYDPEIGGLVGVKPSFGSANFNDHNFHYGYFVYAASVLGRYDKGFIKDHGAMVDALIRDYASPTATKYFPKQRSYDAYFGHSWADGYGQSLSGNNQESSSEAVNADYAIYLWAEVTGNRKLQNYGQWLYANQTNAALNYWTNIGRGQPQFANYQHGIVSLVWQGKLDYGTFFSNSADAKLAIQLIPMSPGQAYLAVNKSRITQNLSVLNSSSQFKDYLLMYKSLGQPNAALAELKRIKPTDIDSADSMSYLYAFVYGSANNDQNASSN